MEGRFAFPADELRTRTVRGVTLTAAALVFFDGLVLAQGLIVTRLLGPRDIGLYGIVSVTLVSLLMLKRVGIDEAFVQQDEAEQEPEFQRAFTLELGMSAVLGVVRGHKGGVLVSSRVGEGTTVSVLLPPAKRAPPSFAVCTSRDPPKSPALP